MSIQFIQETQCFKLDTKNTTYAFQLVQNKYLISTYYGAYVPDTAIQYEKFTELFNLSPVNEYLDYGRFSLDISQAEYVGFNTGDFRQTSVAIENKDGNIATEFYYVSHEIFAGKKPLPGLPATFENNHDAESLEITCEDPVTKIRCILQYSVFAENDVITRSVRFENPSNSTVYLRKAYSATVNLHEMDYDFIHLDGTWADERRFERTPLHKGQQGVGSVRGASSAIHNPFVALAGRTASEDQGDVYGFNFVYSGNFQFEVDCDTYEQTRINIGIHPESFRWKLNPTDSFQTPEVVMVYTNQGLGEMSRLLHRFFIYHLIRSPYAHKERPLLINCWEATTFDINTEVLLRFARSAKEMGMDLLVMDDGWFGDRADDTSSLGDWFINPKKFPNGFGELIDGVNALGMKFGIWFEPEMISPISKVYEAHPDWCVHLPGRTRHETRNQLVMDVSRADVRDYIFESIEKILGTYNIEYIKWDFNRNLSEAGSALLPADQAGEFYHRFVMGTYELMNRLVTRFPNILFENCASGGGRFDTGMLYYSPQIWTSDNTDPIDRLSIQFGTSLCYPASTMGAHVSISDRAGYNTKANVAMWGTFGFELDPDHIKGEDRELCKQKIQDYHKYYDLIHEGDLYRVTCPWDQKGHVSWEFVSPDKKEMLFTRVTMLRKFLEKARLVQKFKGLDPQKNYRLEGTEQVYSGAYLMNVGLFLHKYPIEDGDSFTLHFTAIN